jgi:hypothetical protein
VIGALVVAIVIGIAVSEANRNILADLF